MFINYVHVARDMVRALQWRGTDGQSLLDQMQDRSGCSLRIVTSDLDFFAPGNEQTALISVVHSDRDKADDGSEIISSEVDRLNNLRFERPLPPWAVAALFRDGKYVLKQLRAATDCYMYVSHGNPSKIIVIDEDDKKRIAASNEIRQFLGTPERVCSLSSNFWYKA